SAALQALAEQWPDQTTRDLLAHRAVQDEGSATRSAALKALAQKWPDQTTRDLLAHRALQDEYIDTRSISLQALAEKWPDQTTRDLLAHRAVQDEGSATRSAALQALAEKWPDQITRDLLAQRAVEAPNISDRGIACSILGKMHSEFGRILPTKGDNGAGPYLDPLKPIPRDQIVKAAAEVGLPTEDIATQVASLSAHLGWDITLGAKKGKRVRAKP
ncbi:MAG: HEAT repeat domain-containing protein, partial [Prosthecobacter sp.]|uniref:HEAT repeat domain-containing protein n=1 Tax=Prosthecobacter sp. TaxID=1965333 RepID=UPI003BB0E8C7